MSKSRGRTLSLSPSRRVLGDLLRLARQIPAVPIERTLRLAPPVFAATTERGTPSREAVLVKALGVVSERNPLLRRCYVPLPRPHLYEHPISIASVPVRVSTGDEDVTFPVRLMSPGSMPVGAIDEILRRHRENAPLMSGEFRRIERLGRMPGFARRMLLRIGLAWSGHFHAQQFGTFALSPYAGLGVEALHPLAMFAPTFDHGPAGEGRELRVCLVYDHRVMDGGSAARILAQLEDVLNREIAAELSSATPAEAATWAAYHYPYRVVSSTT